MFEPVSAVGLQLGLTALYSFASAGSAISIEAQAVQQAAGAVVKSVESSQALFGGKAVAISQLWLVANECAEPGWDGESAFPIDRMAVYNAVAFIRAMPDRMPLPEFAPEPDGSISLDWIQSRTRLFSLSVGAGNRLAYAWLDGTDKGHAVARFEDGRIPKRILEGIKGIVNHESAAIRTS